ncbi:MAG: glycosyltransferase family 4 protein [Bryobacteraceae bacterium]
MKQKIKVAFASGTDDLNARLIARMREVFPDLPLYVVSDFRPAEGDLHWVRYQGSILENWARCRSAFRGKSIRLAGVLLVPNVPFRRMRLLALMLAPLYFLAINENLNDFMLRPGSLPAMARHFAWRARNFLRWHLGGDGTPRPRHGRVKPLPEGAAAVFPGKAASGKPRVLVASAYLPFPLSHGGAVRIHNLTARAAADWDQILVAFTETDAPPAAELLDRFVEVVLVRRTGTHAAPSTGRPEVVEQFASASFRTALRETVRKWQPAIAQLEFTQMAQYAADCAPARPILVEHDITFDLYQQLLQGSDDWDLRHQLKLWRRFETAAWREMSCVVTMSEKDRDMVTGTHAVALPNGVDLGRFRPAPQAPEPRRLLFVGSFSHLPNLMAVAFFLDQVWPRLRDVRLHIIAGARHEYFLDYHGSQVKVRLDQPGVEVEGFVSDVRGAYQRAAIVVAPLVVSAGTNLKILEAMACGRPVVATPAGVNGLDLVPGEDFTLVHTAAEMAAAIENLLASPAECHRLAAAGRRRVEDRYGWDEIARRQTELYREVMAG